MNLIDIIEELIPKGWNRSGMTVWATNYIDNIYRCIAVGDESIRLYYKDFPHSGAPPLWKRKIVHAHDPKFIDKIKEYIESGIK